jgi:hypothetical protein
VTPGKLEVLLELQARVFIVSRGTGRARRHALFEFPT